MKRYLAVPAAAVAFAFAGATFACEYSNSAMDDGVPIASAALAASKVPAAATSESNIIKPESFRIGPKIAKKPTVATKETASTLSSTSR